MKSSQHSNLRTFRADEIPPYPLGQIADRVHEARAAGIDVIDLSQFNPSLAPAPLAIDKLVQNVLKEQNHRYSSSQGIQKLREAFSTYYTERHGVTLDPNEETVVTLGTKEGIAHALQAILFPGDTVLLPLPAYPVHRAAICIAGGGLVGIPLFLDDNYHYTLDDSSEDFFIRLEKLCGATWPKPKIMLCSFPHNPSTVVVTESFFERLISFARRHQLLLINDVAYADICFEEYRAPSLMSIPGAKDCSVEFYSLSKGFSLAGWRIGCCVGNVRAVRALKKVKSYLDAGAFQPLQIAAAAVLGNWQAITGEVSEEYRVRRDVLVRGLREMGWSVHLSQATVFLWGIAPKSLGDSGTKVAEKLLHEVGVGVFPGIGFDSQAEKFVRISLADNEKRLRMAVDRIRGLTQD